MSTVSSVKNLRLKFPGNDSLLFKDFSISFQQGEKVLLLGPSGSGKSTLLQVLAGLIPQSIDVPLKADQLTIPESWGFLFQDPDTQFCMPYVDEEIAFVLENVKIPPGHMNDIIVYYLHQVGLELDSIHTRIQTLSGGMKQRLAIASILALQPEVLFLDEPTALLDPEGTSQVWNTIKDIGKEKTVIIVEHKIDEVIDYVDRIVLFNAQGELLGDGPKDVIFQQYKQTLYKQGVWYPGIWDDYLQDSHPSKPVISNPRETPVLSLENFSGYRGKNKKVFVDDTKIYSGEWIAVLGENGAGKTTLLHSLMDLIKTSGAYYVFGKNKKKIKRLSDFVSFVFQNPELQFVTNSVYEELAYTLRILEWDAGTIDHRVGHLLQLFNLDTYKAQHPYQLSMGQKRRLSVAVALAQNQPILLLDEPTFGQDAVNTFAILEELERLRKEGTTIVMATHDWQIVRNFASRCWHIENGRLTKEDAAIECTNIYPSHILQ
ncbi:ABC transporter ATP-binding protein [Sediminibacillus halophilus]|uniref:Energy-coupling factor transport system ATP-binding protein n=1 Tax=Sediminibacillus halophilus TaxID=482461 RepID=A0A1G9S1A4_9BACI|nr:ABC transporter ATP-binding protein [Sediminibacillus halophilus]SDM29047.1 energy-coupling factor transport system ATP-binding protein [Sediminibacillus halophilus]